MRRFVTIILGVIFVVLASSLLNNAYAQLRIEDTVVHSGEKLNPAYLEKKRELDRINKQKEEVENLLKRDWNKAGWDYANHLIRLISKLEYELSQIQMYLPPDPLNSVIQKTTIPATNEVPRESQRILVESRQAPIPVAGEGEVTIVYHSYVSTRSLLPEPVESAGGVKAYNWIIYPSAYFENLMNMKFEAQSANDFPGLPAVTVIGDPAYQIKGTIDDKTEVIKALNNAQPVYCSLLRPAPIRITIPSGRYYIDYWLTLRGNTRWGNTDRLGPRSVNRMDRKDWGPYELNITPNSETKVNVTPYGDNVEFKYIGYYGYEGVLNLINYGDRLGP